MTNDPHAPPPPHQYPAPPGAWPPPAGAPHPLTLTPQDERHLSYLSTAWWIVGGLNALCACFPVIHLVMGFVFMVAPATAGPNPQGGPPPALMGGIFVVVATVAITLMLAISAGLFYVASCLSNRRRWLLCVVVSVIVAVMNVPVGTVLGVLTVIVLMRNPVRWAFGEDVPLGQFGGGGAYPVPPGPPSP
jgi:hypothetical protein